MLGEWKKQSLSRRRGRALARVTYTSTGLEDGLNGHNHADERTGLLAAGRKKARSAWRTIYTFLRLNYCNILLPVVPVALMAGFLGINPIAVFVLNSIAIIPLASLLSDATEELVEHVGHTLGGLLNATFGNATEFIISIFALKKGEIRIVQASMLGNILSNVLLGLGMCFFFGGLSYYEQSFNITLSSTMASLMAVASASLVIPAALYQTLSGTDELLELSHYTAIVLLFLYIMYIYFQFYSHHHLFQCEDESTSGRGPILSRNQAALVLLASTVTISFCADNIFATIDDIAAAAHLSKTFIGLILIPIIGSAAQHVSSVGLAMGNKMNLVVNIALGSGLQIALFVTPFLVIMGWIMGQPMSLYFQTFETIVFALSVLIANYVIQDGKSNYLEGAMLMGIYSIIGVSFVLYPEH